MPTIVTDGFEYTGPFTVNDGTTIYTRAFTELDTGEGNQITYGIARYNLDFQYSENSQYLGVF
jgi:hypothetical protein